MPLTIIEIEQIELDRWVANVEIGGTVCRRVPATGGSFEAIMRAVVKAYHTYVPPAQRPVSDPQDYDADRLPHKLHTEDPGLAPRRGPRKE